MIKTYTARTHVSVSVVLPDGGHRLVSFAPRMDGGSVLYTEDEGVQYGLEHHHRFGKLFWLERSGDNAVADTSPACGKITEQGSNTGTVQSSDAGAEQSVEVEAQVRIVEVSDVTEAKDYLAENHGIVRTKMKRQSDIDRAAKSVGIEFKYL